MSKELKPIGWCCPEARKRGNPKIHNTKYDMREYCFGRSGSILKYGCNKCGRILKNGHLLGYKRIGTGDTEKKRQIKWLPLLLGFGLVAGVAWYVTNIGAEDLEYCLKGVDAANSP